MTPGARVAAAIAVLDEYLGGVAAEKALTNWGRRSRFAGSKDRAAVRDLVFDALRRRRSCGSFSDATSTRLWLAAVLKSQGLNPAELFDGQGHAPDVLSEGEVSGLADLPTGDPDLPNWVFAELQDTHGADKAQDIATVLQTRAPITLRVNLRQGAVDQAIASLAADGVDCMAAADVDTVLHVMSNPRRVQSSAAFQAGLVEIQDAHSQAITALVPVDAGQRVLDYCAGGGGKTLALAARADAQWFAHDADPKRLDALDVRAKRAGVRVTKLTTDGTVSQAPFDVVVCDVPCSGSGAWRRSPAARWATSPADVDAYVTVQQQIVEQALALVKPGGVFAYFTCSVFARENQMQRDWMLQQHPGLDILSDTSFLPSAVGDGFYALIARVREQN